MWHNVHFSLFFVCACYAGLYLGWSGKFGSRLFDLRAFKGPALHEHYTGFFIVPGLVAPASLNDTPVLIFHMLYEADCYVQVEQADASRR